MEYVNKKLRNDVKRVFESKYGRKLTNEEIYQIAENLEVVVEEILKLKWRQKYEYSISRT